MSKIANLNEKIAENVVSGYQKMENGVVSGYMKIQRGAVQGFQKVSDKCVKMVFAKEGETVEQTKERLSRNQ